MVEALKKINKKILVIAGIIILSPILLIIFLAIIQGCGNSNITHNKYEKKMITAAQNYFEDNDKLPKNESEIKTVKLDKLVSEGYIKSPSDLLGDDSCNGSVMVRKNGSSKSEKIDGYLNYVVNLKCDSYKTKSLKNSLMEQLTTQDSGLYSINNEYIFKGDDVNNYLMFFGSEYRIIKIDEKGNLKLLKTLSEEYDEYWDDKYNIEVNDSYGKNIYKDSSILKKLYNDYNNDDKYSESARKHIVSQDICIYSKDVNDFDSNKNVNCTSVLEDQTISLIDINDFYNASLDPDCTTLNSKSCKNYNYLDDINLNTWTYVAVANNSYEVYYISNGIIRKEYANRYNSYNHVIFIDGNELYKSGDGSKDNPFVME